ncbi:MAG: DUF1232 domain-containing protein [Patescibacteria group bacterium]|jgi:uncharacterized membrane protein YkvA (DUF1232 family)
MSRSHSFIPDWKNIVGYFRDPKTDWKPKVAVGLALLYLIWPVDLFPDFLPFIGWLDDIGLDVLVVWYLLYEVNKYVEQKEPYRRIENKEDDKK